MSQAERKTKIDSAHGLPVTRQCKVLSISRSSAYYQPRPQEFESELRKRPKISLSTPPKGIRRGFQLCFGHIPGQQGFQLLKRIR